MKGVYILIAILGEAILLGVTGVLSYQAGRKQAGICMVYNAEKPLSQDFRLDETLN